MLSIVGVVGLCVHVFSLGYMHDDAAKARYFGGLSIFMFSMIGIVLADNLFMMFIFWELVGFSSYFLINHWNEKASASDAAKKAFIVNRVGDFGFLLGIITCYWMNGTVNLSELAAGHVYSRLIPLLLFCGAVGKSAQLPLQVWLPDAMEGPTPVSALIHAATMVAAGIYMLCRINVLMVPDALAVIAWVGTLTALYAALCAITQRDIKKVLAYSTLSQLGYMVAAFGLGSVGAAMFHLTTHAFFKALLFLGSGSVIFGCHHEQDIFRMGGLRTRMPVTFWTFTIAVAAIIGRARSSPGSSPRTPSSPGLPAQPGGLRGAGVHRHPHRVLHAPPLEDRLPRRAAERVGPARPRGRPRPSRRRWSSWPRSRSSAATRGSTRGRLRASSR
jgi:NADH-quinone oxidoreductase subunit L